jgi:hypothetical protein
MVCAAALGLLRKREQDLRWLVANPFWLPAPLEPLFERLNYSAVDVAYLLAACLTDQKVALPSHHPVLPRGPPLSPPRAATWQVLLVGADPTHLAPTAAALRALIAPLTYSSLYIPYLPGTLMSSSDAHTLLSDSTSPLCAARSPPTTTHPPSDPTTSSSCRPSMGPHHHTPSIGPHHLELMQTRSIAATAARSPPLLIGPHHCCLVAAAVSCRGGGGDHAPCAAERRLPAFSPRRASSHRDSLRARAAWWARTARCSRRSLPTDRPSRRKSWSPTLIRAKCARVRRRRPSSSHHQPLGSRSLYRPSAR